MTKWIFLLLLLGSCAEKDKDVEMLEEFKTDTNVASVYVGEFHGDQMVIVKKLGSKSNVIGVPEPTKNTLTKLLWNPVKTCIVSEVRHMTNKLYREESEKLGLKFISLCPLEIRKEKFGFVGVGYSEVPDNRIIIMQEDLAKDLEVYYGRSKTRLR